MIMWNIFLVVWQKKKNIKNGNKLIGKLIRKSNSKERESNIKIMIHKLTTKEHYSLANEGHTNVALFRIILTP